MSFIRVMVHILLFVERRNVLFNLASPCIKHSIFRTFNHSLFDTLIYLGLVYMRRKHQVNICCVKQGQVNQVLSFRGCMHNEYS